MVVCSWFDVCWNLGVVGLEWCPCCRLKLQQHSRKLLMMDILMSETCWAHKKWNRIASDINFVFCFQLLLLSVSTALYRHAYVYLLVMCTADCSDLETKTRNRCVLARLRQCKYCNSAYFLTYGKTYKLLSLFWTCLKGAIRRVREVWGLCWTECEECCRLAWCNLAGALELQQEILSPQNC